MYIYNMIDLNKISNISNLDNNFYYLYPLDYKHSKFLPLLQNIEKQLKDNGYILRLTKEGKQCIKVLCLNLYIRSYKRKQYDVVNVYKSEKTFHDGSFYRDVFRFSYKSFNAVINGFCSLGFIDHKAGDIEFDKEKRKKFIPTRIRATPKFYAFLSEFINMKNIIVPPSAEIQLKTGYNLKNIKKHYISHNPLTLKNKKLTKQIELKRYNKLSLKTTISLNGNIFNKPDVMYKRIFHQDFHTYGRLHCGKIQGIKKESRPDILFNGEPTIEVDIVSSHLLLAYALDGYDLTTMPPAYELDGIDCDKYGNQEQRLNRDILKMFLLLFLNTSSAYDCSKALNNRIRKMKDSNKHYDQILVIARLLPGFNQDVYSNAGYAYEGSIIAKALYDKHKVYVKDWLDDKRAGMKLMYIESCIIFDVINHFTDKGIYCISIYDSIRIAKPHQEELMEVMLSTIQQHLNIQFHNPNKVVELNK